jgi:quercetin dioxygenase-like cupin family protein
VSAEPRRAATARADSVAPVSATAGAERFFAGARPAVRPVHDALGTSDVQVNVVAFEAGARSRPHVHTSDQVLHFVSGSGIVALAGGPDQRVTAGDFVLLPAGVVHMHGAADDGPATHLSITREVEIDWDCEVPEAWMRWARPSA